MFFSRTWVFALNSYLLFNGVLSFPRPIPLNDGDSPKELLGDLLTVGVRTTTGQTVQNILLGLETGQSVIVVDQASACGAQSVCCVWYSVAADLTKLFLARDGTCNDDARAAIRLGFHDAGTWSKSNKAAGLDFGGADGSILIAAFGEQNRGENNGLQTIIVKMQKLAKKWKVGLADLVQYAATHAVVTCPLGPRVRTFVGRKDATQPAPPGLLPSVHALSSDLIALFQDKTIDPHTLTALLGAHSCSKQFNQDTTHPGSAQDSTPGVWDVKFYNETIATKPNKKLFVFDSDKAIASDVRTATEWRAFITDQGHWNEDYSAAYVRLSMLGVNNINDLTECTATLPAARTKFP
ncbi:hypothetical protein ONS96_005811 [Cadophora gregata f. sp. sojae]|nr:hypothetical protein ONS96_005811 [Cadophora gregata f. sp. sojae]